MVIGGSLARLSIPLVLIGVVISSFMLFMDYKAVPEVREVRHESSFNTFLSICLISGGLLNILIC